MVLSSGNKWTCKKCLQHDSKEEEEEVTIPSGSKRLANGAPAAPPSATLPQSATKTRASPRSVKEKKVNLDPDVPEEPYSGVDYFQHDLCTDDFRHERDAVDSVVECTQTTLRESQTVAGKTLLDQLFSFLNYNKKPIRTFFFDHDKHLLLGIMESLVRAIYATKDGPQRELLFGVFTAFPAIYCCRLRGGPEDRRRYTTFLRKRREHPDFTTHVLYLVKPQYESDESKEDPHTDNRTKKERIESLARRGKCAQALSALEESRALETTPEVKRLLQELHPAATENYTNIYPSQEEGSSRGDASYFSSNQLVEPFDRADLTLALRGLRYKAAPSMSGWTKEFFMILMREATNTVVDFLPQFFSNYVNLKLPPAILSFSANSSMFGLMKTPIPLAVRPVAIPCFLNKLAWKMSMFRVNKSFLEGTVQMGLGTKAGCQSALYVLQSAIMVGKIVVKLDSKNAFNTVSRSKFLKIFYNDKRYKAMWPLLHLNYQKVCYLVLPNGDLIISQEGTRQGGVEGSFIFSVALQSVNKMAQEGVRYVQIIDDIFIIVDPTEERILGIQKNMNDMEDYLADLGLELRRDKTNILCQPYVWDRMPSALVEHRARDLVTKEPLSTYYCLGGYLLLDFTGDCQKTLSSAVQRKIWEKKLAPYKQFDTLGVDLQIQHLILQTSTIPSCEYLLGATWVLNTNDRLFDQLREWYINHFMPLGEPSDALLCSKSGPLTKALLHLPISAGGGLGLPSAESVFYCRSDLRGLIFAHRDKYPWLSLGGDFDKKFREMKTSFTPPPMKQNPLKPYSIKERLVHHFTSQIAYEYYGNVHHQRWMQDTKHRDTRVYKIPPEFRRHRIENNTFRHTLAAVAKYAPGLSISKTCNNNASPNLMQAESQADVIDHVLHCPGCAASAITRKHNSVNYAVKRVLRQYGVDYTLEPRGLPMPKTKKEEQKQAEQQKKYKKQDGPDGLLNTHAGLTALEIHCSHQRLYMTESDAKDSHFDSVEIARSGKKSKYSTFPNIYKGIAVEVFTVSTGGVIHPKTLSRIKEQWLPVADQSGRGLLRMLQVEVAFEVSRAVGVIVQMVKTLKNA